MTKSHSDPTTPWARLRALRKTHKLTQSQMADRVGCSYESLRRYEWGPEHPHAWRPGTRNACKIRDATAALGDEIDPEDWHA